MHVCFLEWKKTRNSRTCVGTKTIRRQLRGKNESKIGNNEVMDCPNSGEIVVDGTEYFETQENLETQGNDDFEYLTSIVELLDDMAMMEEISRN